MHYQASFGPRNNEIVARMSEMERPVKVMTCAPSMSGNHSNFVGMGRSGEILETTREAGKLDLSGSDTGKVRRNISANGRPLNLGSALSRLKSNGPQGKRVQRSRCLLR
jgi:hypothetical protein